MDLHDLLWLLQWVPSMSTSQTGTKIQPKLWVVITMANTKHYGFRWTYFTGHASLINPAQVILINMPQTLNLMRWSHTNRRSKLVNAIIIGHNHNFNEITNCFCVQQFARYLHCIEWLPLNCHQCKMKSICENIVLKIVTSNDDRSIEGISSSIVGGQPCHQWGRNTLGIITVAR